MKKIKLIVIMAFIVGLSSCKKEEVETKDVVTPPPTKQEILASKTWQISAATCSPDMMGETDMFKYLDPCEKDNTLKFSNDASKTLVINEGGNICTGRTLSKTTRWSLDTDGKTFMMDNVYYTLNSLSSESLIVSHDEEMDGKNYTITCTYSSK